MISAPTTIPPRRASRPWAVPAIVFAAAIVAAIALAWSSWPRTATVRAITDRHVVEIVGAFKQRHPTVRDAKFVTDADVLHVTDSEGNTGLIVVIGDKDFGVRSLAAPAQ